MAFKEKEELEARVKALEAERLHLKGRLEAEQQSRPQLAHTMWGAMDALEEALPELEVGMSECSHEEEDVGTSVGCLRDATSLTLTHGMARSYGSYCSRMTAQTLIGLLHLEGCNHVDSWLSRSWTFLSI